MESVGLMQVKGSAESWCDGSLLFVSCLCDGSLLSVSSLCDGSLLFGSSLCDGSLLFMLYLCDDLCVIIFAMVASFLCCICVIASFCVVFMGWYVRTCRPIAIAMMSSQIFC